MINKHVMITREDDIIDESIASLPSRGFGPSSETVFVFVVFSAARVRLFPLEVVLILSQLLLALVPGVHRHGDVLRHRERRALLLGMRAFVFFKKDMNASAARWRDDAAVAADPGVCGPRGSAAASPPPAAAPPCNTISAR